MACGVIAFSSATFFFLSANAPGGASTPTARSVNTTRLLFSPLRFVFIVFIELPPRKILVARGTECPIVRLVFYQQIGLCRRVWLMARQAVDLRPHLTDIFGINHIVNRMRVGRMPTPIFHRQ